MGRTIYMELLATSKIASDLSAGGLLVQDKTLALHETCEIVVFNDSGQLELPAKAVYVDGNGGVGLELVGFGAALKAKLAELIEAGEAAAAAGSDVGAEPAAEPAAAKGLGSEPMNLGLSDVIPIVRDLALGSERASDIGALGSNPEIANAGDLAIVVDDDALDLGIDDAVDAELAGGTAEPAAAKAASEMGDLALEEDADEEKKTLHERLRNMPLIEQIKLARAGDVTERMLLERMHGKNVWEPLLRNPRLTAMEAARIAKMGALPRPLIEVILGNGAWLQVPEVRRSLLSNPRLGTDQIIKLLRMMSKQELKLATMQTTYSTAVRQQAKAMLKAEGAG